ncbi:MAG: glycosyltransferase family 2 protein [Butyrivibrio sp.]
MKTVDIIVPCYNEQEVLTTFFKETEKILHSIEDYSFRYLFIDDGSKDDTLLLIKGLASTYDYVEYISFSRNFGKEAGMYAGLSNSTGDYVIIMDADLQHPPALIPRMIESVEKGHDCCAAYRTNRKGEKAIRSFFSRNFYKLNNKLTDVKMPYGAVDYRIMTRNMADSIVSLSEVQRFSKGIFCWVGFDTEWIPYENVERAMGTTKWSFKGLTRYAMDGILSFSVVPLKLLSIMGFTLSGIAIIYAIFILIKTIVQGIDAPGYASTIIIVLLLGGIVEISIGVLGAYIARIYTEIKHRPIYIARENSMGKDHVSDEGLNKKADS